MDFRDTPEYHGSTEVGLSSGLIGMSTIMFGLRIFVRLFVTKSFGLDDGLTVVAYVSSTFFLSRTCARRRDKTMSLRRTFDC